MRRPGAPMRVVAELEYVKGRRIGASQGQNSEVHLSHDPQIGGVVVVKELDKARIPDPTRYFAEAHAMFAAAHPNVVPIKYACQTPGVIALVMPYYPIGSLADRIADDPLSPCAAIRMGLDTLVGVRAIHSNGLLHLDIKPSNVLFDSANRALVADFGQSEVLGPGGVVTGLRMYDRAIPPECFLHGAAIVATDLYQVGLTLYRAVNGDRWFNSQQPSDLRSAVISGDFPDRNAFAPHVPSRLRTVIRQALDKDHTTRIPTATAFIDALTQIAVSIDWRQSTVGPGHVRWTGTPLGRAGLEVDLAPNGSRYDVTIHTVTSTARRAKQQAALWKSDMTNRKAYDHLNKVFRVLS